MIPAAVMAFDQGIIDEKTISRWDGKDYGRVACNRDQTIKSWMVDSVVWVTQRLMESTGSPEKARMISGSLQTIKRNR